jgi:hypothetical protein
MLLPSFKAGIDMLVRLDAYRHTMSTISDALVIFGPDSRELYRNSVFTRLYELDPEREHILTQVIRMAFNLYPLNASKASPSRNGFMLAPEQGTVSTQKAPYKLSGTLLPPGVFETETGVKPHPGGGIIIFFSNEKNWNTKPSNMVSLQNVRI